MPNPRFVTRSTDPRLGDGINGLLSGKAWWETTLTYAFPTWSGAYLDYGLYAEPSTFQPLTADHQSMVRRALTEFSRVSSLTFEERPGTTVDPATILFGGVVPDTWQTLAWAYLPWWGGRAGDVWLNSSRLGSSGAGSRDYTVVLHELGHALGLKHGHEKKYGFPALPLALDSNEFTLMTYRSRPGGRTDYITNASGSYPQSLMRYDIAALQYLYGANYQTEAGDTVYSFDPATGSLLINGAVQSKVTGGKIFRTIWDGGGRDTYDLSNFGKGSRIDLRAGASSLLDTTMLAILDYTDPLGSKASANLYNAYLYQGDVRSLIENAIGGAGDDTLDGNEANNDLQGRGGADRLSGGDGNDTLDGGDGNDTLDGGAGEDVLKGGAGSNRIDGAGGRDVVAFDGTYGTYAWSLNSNATTNWIEVTHKATNDVTFVFAAEMLRFADRDVSLFLGTAGVDALAGSASADILWGGFGNDVLDGGEGDDSLFGGVGNDSLHGGSGSDFMRGNEGDDTLAGGDGGDTLEGSAGDDVLSGGAGSNRLNGGEGRDIAVFQGLSQDFTWNLFSSATSDGWIEVTHKVTRDVTTVLGVEVLRFTDRDVSLFLGTLGDDVANGTTAADILWGARGNDTLDGGNGDDTVYGGLGDDSLRGGTGRDVLGGSEGDDTLAARDGDTLDGGDGRDVVVFDGAYADISWSLRSGATEDGFIEVTDRRTGAVSVVRRVETLRFTDRDLSLMLGTAGGDALTGGDVADLMWGAYGDDTIDGGGGDDSIYGGVGNDSLRGGDGNDLLRGNAGDDTLDGGGGNNTVTYNTATTGVTVDLALGIATGEGRDVLLNIRRVNGSVHGDTLIGNDADNRFYGDAGDDTIDGGAGQDTSFHDGVRADYDIFHDAAAGVLVVRDRRAGSPGGTDRLSRIEVLRFADGDVDAAVFVNRAPTALTLDTANIRENSAAGTLVGTATAVDPDLADSVRYSLRTIEGLAYDGPFVIEESTGRILVAPGSTLDFETEKSYGLVIRATDRGGLFIERTVTIAIDNVVETQIPTSAGATDEECRLTGTADADVLSGGSGDDTLSGGGGDDRLEGYGGNDSLVGGSGADTMRGGAGNDTYVVDHVGDIVVEAAGEGRDSVRTTLTAYVLGEAVESLAFAGRGAFTGTGNALANAVSGGRWNDVLAGLGGNDTLSGGAGDDSLDGGDGADVVDGGAGADTMRGGAGADTFYVRDLADVIADVSAEDLVVVGVAGYDVAAWQAAGVRVAYALKATAVATDWHGGDQSDTLDGSAGPFVLAGGNGNETYIADDDAIVEGDNGGIDTVRTSAAAHSLAANVENLVSTRTGAFEGRGNGLANRITGGAGNDTLDGDAGNDTLSGGGGADLLRGGEGADSLDGGSGADTMTGGAGRDVFVIDDLRDATDAGADDTVILRVRGYDLSSLNGASVRYALTGISGGQSLSGGTGADTLDGGLDADTLAGGDGNDLYTVDNVGDRIVEGAGGGRDTVRASISWTLAAEVENLTLTGSDDLDGWGNDVANVLTGNTGGNLLSGGGGRDTIEGGAGSDWLVGGDDADVFVFRAGHGHDVVMDFEAERTDRLQVSRGLFADWSALWAATRQEGSDIVITVSPDDTITLTNVSLASFGQEDVRFVA